MSKRTEKVNALIQEDIAEILQKEISLKSSVFVSVIKVDTSPDLRYAKVFLSVYPINESNYALKTIQKEHYRIQKVLHGKLHMKIIPKIEFRLDNTQEKVSELEELFQKIREEDEI